MKYGCTTRAGTAAVKTAKNIVASLRNRMRYRHTKLVVPVMRSARKELLPGKCARCSELMGEIERMKDEQRVLCEVDQTRGRRMGRNISPCTRRRLRK